MKGPDSFIQAYNAQAAVDADAQIIVAHRLTNNDSDQDALLVLFDAVEQNTGEMPDEVSGDNGFCSEANLEGLIVRAVRGYVAAGRASKPAAGKKAAGWCRPGSGKLDQAGWHGSDALVVPPNITLIPLPSKYPKLNPVENVWQFMRDN